MEPTSHLNEEFVVIAGWTPRFGESYFMGGKMRGLLIADFPLGVENK